MRLLAAVLVSVFGTPVEVTREEEEEIRRELGMERGMSEVEVDGMLRVNWGGEL